MGRFLVRRVHGLASPHEAFGGHAGNICRGADDKKRPTHDLRGNMMRKVGRFPLPAPRHGRVLEYASSVACGSIRPWKQRTMDTDIDDIYDFDKGLGQVRIALLGLPWSRGSYCHVM